MNADSETIKAQKISAFRSIHENFKNIMEKEQCRTCSCFHADVLNSVYDKIRNFQKREPDPRVQVIQRDFENWFKQAAALKMHE